MSLDMLYGYDIDINQSIVIDFKFDFLRIPGSLWYKSISSLRNRDPSDIYGLKVVNKKYA